MTSFTTTRFGDVRIIVGAVGNTRPCRAGSIRIQRVRGIAELIAGEPAASEKS